MSKKFMIIGGGPAGIEAARTAALAGQEVKLVSDSPLGGRAGWHSLLPSKIWLASAHNLDILEEVESLGIKVHKPEISTGKLLEKISVIKKRWSDKMLAELLELGVNIIQGTAAFKSANEVEIRNKDGEVAENHQADITIVATGSVPIFPDELKPDGQKVIAPRFLSHLEEIPESMIVIGAGPTGCESAYLFNRLGSKVTWIVDQFGILPSFHQDAGRALGVSLVRQGVKIVKGQMASKIHKNDTGITVTLADGSQYSAELAFVAIGRRPDLARLNLDNAGLVLNASGLIELNDFGLSTNPTIYFIGDASGGWMIANKAMAQARVAVKHAIGEQFFPYRQDLIVQVTFTNPQVAQVGIVTANVETKSVRIPYEEGLKANIEGSGQEYLEIFYDEIKQHIKGAVILGRHGADLLTPLVMAIQQKISVEAFGEIYAGHPTFGELPFIAARKVI